MLKIAVGPGGGEPVDRMDRNRDEGLAGPHWSWDMNGLSHALLHGGEVAAADKSVGFGETEYARSSTRLWRWTA